jgi:hypothetical protein
MPSPRFARLAPAFRDPSGERIRIATLTLLMAGLSLLVLLQLGSPLPHSSLGHAAGPQSLSLARVPSSLGGLVTLVGPLGLTFPCWAALHPRRSKARTSGPQP